MGRKRYRCDPCKLDGAVYSWEIYGTVVTRESIRYGMVYPWKVIQIQYGYDLCKVYSTVVTCGKYSARYLVDGTRCGCCM